MIYLTGFMGSGKSAVARALAGLLDVPSYDMDALICERTGHTIAEIFACAGEGAFRQIERELLCELAAGAKEAVVATGGGLPVEALNRRVMQASGWIVHLKARLETLRARVGEGEGRPLWGASTEGLYQSRRTAYADCDLSLATDARGIEEVAREIQRRLPILGSPAPVLLRERSYPVYVGEGILEHLPWLLQRHIRPEGLFGLEDANVARLYGQRLVGLMGELPHRVMEVPPGEEAKSMAFLERVLGCMLSSGTNRNWALVALGGGVTGDLGGLAASLFMRGIPVIHLPTTLLAQVDSSLGGKTAVNHPQGKNLVGTFHQPLFVVCDSALLQSLPAEQVRSAMAEVIKYGIIMDRELFEYLEREEAPAHETLVRLCCRDKAAIVSADEREGELRRILNFGHTLGHAVEQTTGFTIHHGLGVALGMAFAAWLSNELGLLTERDLGRIMRLLRRYCPVDEGVFLPGRAAVEAALLRDKKGAAAGLHFVLTQGVGSATVRKLTVSNILEAYERYIYRHTQGLQ